MPYLLKSLILLILLSCSEGEEEGANKKKNDAPVEETDKKENTDDKIDAASLTYDGIQQIIKDNCLNCHNTKEAGGTGQQPIFATLDQVKEYRKPLYDVIVTKRMPLGGGNFKVVEDRKRLLDWLEGGKEFDGPMSVETLSSQITRMIPEQVSAKFKYNLGYTEGFHHKGLNKFIDTIFRNNNVALGGKDTNTLRDRNHSMRIQTLLSINSLVSKAAWSLSNEWDKEKEPRLFKICRAHECRPYMPFDDEQKPEKQEEAKEYERQWKEQLTDIFYKFYARKPTEEEVNFLKEKFIKIYDAEKKADPEGWWGGLARNSWVVLIYGMMKSVEFWHY